LHRLLQIFPSFLDIFDGFFIEADETVNLDIGKLVILTPRALQMIEKVSVGKKNTVKFQAIRHAHREKKKVSGGNKPGQNAEKPQPQPPGQIEQYFIRHFFHKSIIPPLF